MQSLFFDNNLPVLVDFYTSWCQPCKAMSPYLEQIALEFQNKIKVIKFNIDQNDQVAKYYNITSVPTLMLFKRGKVIKKRIGGGTKMDIYNFIKDVL